MTTSTRNGTIRKSLADQIDRLDRTLDGLADNLNQAVASAVKEAVQNVLVEVMTNPDLANLIRNTANPSQSVPTPPNKPTQDETPPRRPGFFARIWAKTRRAVQAVCGEVATRAKQLAQACLSVGQKAWNGCRYLGGLVCSGLGWLWNQVKALGIAVTTLVSHPVLAAVTRVKRAFTFVRILVTAPAT